MKTSFSLRLFVVLVLAVSVTVSQERFEINTTLMESTFKIVGQGSIGTVFVLGLPSKKDTTRAFYVMITAAHVLDGIKGDDAVLHLRAKSPAGDFTRLQYSFKIRQNGSPLWTHHPDPSVDVAAMYVRLPQTAYMPLLLPTYFLATDTVLSEFEIHPGDELICLGYPFGFEANDAGFPILRSGRIASYPLMPTQKVKTFLFDFTVFQGNSGGPVYFYEANRNYKGGTHIGAIQFIAGLVIEEASFAERIETLYETREHRYPLRLAKAIHASLIAQTIAKLPAIE
jgi:hypothetical protein